MNQAVETVCACLWLQVFFGSWLLFPILFLMGPEGFGHLSPWGSIIAHTFADLLSKNLWGLLAHHLRNKVRLQLCCLLRCFSEAACCAVC